MIRPVVTSLVSALLLLPCTAEAQSTARVDRNQEVSIPFITRGHPRAFRPDRDGRGVYIQNARRQWFYARFFTRCNELPFATRIGFQTFGGGSTLSRGDTIIAGRERCRIASIVRSDPPTRPRRARRS
ncbi:MAG: hypothetical protein J7500_02170 [Sphingomonas sp.]|uniref:DUF6491 family protein n=1 Tax=Sphingomonas sp. TaxID=28214 RepID=UPI001B1A92EE|nr:DUF6491 family protein [Sphingomonas sp.]MBO9621497.1 hypothetical protein [Sphingomonas sp.]